jgi:hypothetical protein
MSVLTFGEKKVVRVEVYGSTFPANLISIADTPAESIEHGHDDTACKDHNPTDQQQVGDQNKDHASCNKKLFNFMHLRA